MHPGLWGANFWQTINLLVYMYPRSPSVERQRSMETLIWHLGNNLPCPFCTYHFRRYTEKNPIRFPTRDVFENWVLKLHNDVNRRAHKKEYTLEEARKAFNQKMQSVVAEYHRKERGEAPASKDNDDDSTGKGKHTQGEETSHGQGGAVIILAFFAGLLFCHLWKARTGGREKRTNP